MVTDAKFAIRPSAPNAVSVGFPTRVSVYATPVVLVAPAGRSSASVAPGTDWPGPVKRPVLEVELRVSCAPPAGAGCESLIVIAAGTPAGGSSAPVM